MKLELLYALVKRFEGCRLTPYLDVAGVWTAGWGSTGVDVFPGRAWTQDYADRRMASDAVRFARGTIVLCPNLSEEALCAVADFAYNLGLKRLRTSTLKRKLNAGEMAAARSELLRWVRAGGRIQPGLILRRSEEAKHI